MIRLIPCLALLALASFAEDKPAFETQLLEAAAKYKEYHRVDDQIHVAPLLCERSRSHSEARLSASTDEKTHGRKLYYLFARHRDQYWNAEKHPAQRVGQIIVKEAWTSTNSKVGQFSDPHTQLPAKTVEHNGENLRPLDKSGLFVMLKLDPKTAGTDNGWVYGTLSADGKTVTASGRIASCMKCHEEAKYDRLFGLTKDAKLPK